MSMSLLSDSVSSSGEPLIVLTQTFVSNCTTFYIPPPLPLVCVETNPGPKGAKKAVITVKKGKGKAKVSIVKGRGDYSIAENIGGALGRMAGSAIGKIFGAGAYTVKGNTLHTNSVPQFAMTKNGNEFAHREFVADIFSGQLSGGATVFTLQQFIINPADEALFPWISQIAENYEMYELLGLIFEYVPASGNSVSSTNAALGTVVMATQYNSLDAPFTSKRQMESYEFATSTVPSCPMLHPVECASQANTLTTLYVNNPGAQTTIGDPRFANIGTLNIATVGQQAAGVNLGELWVTAHIRFKRPRLAPAAYTAHFYTGPGATPGPGNPFFATTTTGAIGSTQYILDAPNTTIAGIGLSNSGTSSAGFTVTWPVGYRGVFMMTWGVTQLTGSDYQFVQSMATATTGGINNFNLFGNPSTGAPLTFDLLDTVGTAGQFTHSIAGAYTFTSDGTGGTINFKKGATATPTTIYSEIVFGPVAVGTSQ
jgi:hypothetical protein